MTRINASFRFRRDISTVWTSKNPLLEDGEPAVEIDKGRMKIGDGIHYWNELDYFIPEDDIQELIDNSSGAGTGLIDHINSPLPHPVYDDGPSLLLLYENAKAG